MGTSARLTIAITCVVVAVVLHLSLCQWLTSWSQKGQPILTIETNEWGSTQEIFLARMLGSLV